MPVRVIGLTDTFDAMTSERPYRESLSVGAALSEIVRLTPQKFDPDAVQGLLLQVRRDAAGSNRTPFFQEQVGQHRARRCRFPGGQPATQNQPRTHVFDLACGLLLGAGGNRLGLRFPWVSRTDVSNLCPKPSARLQPKPDQYFRTWIGRLSRNRPAINELP